MFDHLYSGLLFGPPCIRYIQNSLIIVVICDADLCNTIRSYEEHIALTHRILTTLVS